MDSACSIPLSENDRKWQRYATRVAEEIKAAWRHQSPPKCGIEIVPCTQGDECKECAEYNSFFQTTTLDRLALQPDLLWTKVVALKRFSPQYFAYFLPLFLLATLTAPCTLASIAKTIRLYAFPADDLDTERLAVLTACQVEAINHYLELYRALEAEHLSESCSSSYDSASNEPFALYL